MTDAVEVYTGDRAVRRAVAQVRQAPMTVGNAWRKEGKKDGEILWGALELSAGIAHDLGLSPRSDYQLFPIIGGLVYPNAEAYRILLLRHGGDLTFTADTPSECTVVVTGTNGKTYPPFTVTITEAQAAGWGSASGLQSKDPRAILRARASRRAIKLYQPQVLAVVPAHLWGDEDPGPEVVGAEPPSGPEPLAASTRQEAVSGTTQHKLRAAIDRLTPGQRHTLIEQWRFEQLPAVDQLDLDQFMAALDLILDVIADDDSVYEEPDPDREADADTYRYDPADDDGRPF